MEKYDISLSQEVKTWDDFFKLESPIVVNQKVYIYNNEISWINFQDLMSGDPDLIKDALEQVSSYRRMKLREIEQIL